MKKHIYKEIVIPAKITRVWKAWTVKEELIKFFSPEAEVEMKIGGKYEMYFLVDNPVGTRGGEGNKILSFLPHKMLSFSWNAPPQYPEVRKEKTWCVLFFDKLDLTSTKIRFYHLGWQEGDEWDQVYDYFQKAWDYVLGNLQKYFEKK
ncbi:MAG: SRPBCC domain-containing protein [Candidatus Cloacimonetes bacterium]|nr:SRPBCC domain-containing protein [Candidatus Cloacimonadota bacterium]MCF7813188.1 SRPBCC domain-containing protein [Candidatus Cloacimonadota bacterium]MCF7867636.1 SRPBCC domain-containing protein [Candidatus Cloacimonadota bacterium]MCF7883089.1 SRPBCC domain-containing protein [Candidatus Cloacimonadota bacterium]